MAFWSSLLGIRWISVGLTIAKWGSIVAVVSYLGWNVISNYQLREDLAVIENEINRVVADNREMKRRLDINERELEKLQKSRLESRMELQEALRELRELNLDPDTANKEEVENTINNLWEDWFNEAESNSNNN